LSLLARSYNSLVAIDVDGQIRYWRDGAADDLEAARALLAANKLRHAGFFVHLAIEKALKARVVAATKDLPPRSHDLLSLSGRAGVQLTPAQNTFVGRIQLYCLEGRYPAQIPAAPTNAALTTDLNEAQELIRWLTAPLNKP
jgi:HEPN domain-containing protein